MHPVHSALITVIIAAMFVAGGCHNTARGVKEDTAHALHKSGEKIEKAGDKLDHRR
ncbi:MAG TPA: hypothetical protein VIF15_21000 [Polyangiaceae bacterium]|jgi:predicted small secreted protein